MKSTMIEPMLTTATIKAIDGVARKFKKAEDDAEGAIQKLITRWNVMTAEEKQHVAGIVIGTATTAATAILAMRRAAKSPVKKTAKRAAKGVVRRMVKKLT